MHAGTHSLTYKTSDQDVLQAGDVSSRTPLTYSSSEALPGTLQLHSTRAALTDTFSNTCESGVFSCRPATGEISSLSCEPCPGHEVVVSLFEVEYSAAAVTAFIEREHEFRFVAVTPFTLDGQQLDGHRAVICAKNTDEHYRATRCPQAEFERRWGQYGVDRVWRDDVLPCRVYLRHCVLAAQSFCPEAYNSFLDNTFLADRSTTVRQYLELHPEIMQELPPNELVQRYNG